MRAESSIILKSDAENILSACVGLAHVSGSYTPEARQLAEAIAQALGLQLAPVSDWHVWHPGDDDIDVQPVAHDQLTRGHQSYLASK